MRNLNLFLGLFSGRFPVGTQGKTLLSFSSHNAFTLI